MGDNTDPGADMEIVDEMVDDWTYWTGQTSHHKKIFGKVITIYFHKIHYTFMT